MDKVLVLADIHGNLNAFEAVLRECETELFSYVVLLGDCIDYGMRSNEVIEKLVLLEKTEWKNKIIANIWGNHEKLVVDKELEKLSTDRGRSMARYTAQHLSEEAMKYINSNMNRVGLQEFKIEEINCLAIHGSLEDAYWKAVGHNNLRGNYSDYDIVFSGHSHYSHFFTHFYDYYNPELRNMKAVTFINPGSVGQPRNQNPCAQYAVLHLPTKRVELRTVEYNIKLEQSLYPDELDAFYKNRLTYGV